MDLSGAARKEVAMVAHPIRRLEPAPITLLDWILILVGTLLAWLFWPPMHS